MDPETKVFTSVYNLKPEQKGTEKNFQTFSLHDFLFQKYGPANNQHNYKIDQSIN